MESILLIEIFKIKNCFEARRCKDDVQFVKFEEKIKFSLNIVLKKL